MYAVLDLGSNSFHLLIAEEKKRHVKFHRASSYKVRLEEGIGKDKKISKEARARAVSALRAIRIDLASFPVHQLTVVGTSTFREAANASKILDDASELGFKIQVIDGLQEAYYIYKGVQEFLHHPKDAWMVFDIGGGSTEFAVGSDQSPWLLDSITLGCVTNNYEQAQNERITPVMLTKLRQKAHDIIEKQLKPGFYTADWKRCFVTSGSAKMLKTVLRENNITDGTITRNGLRELETKVTGFSTVNDFHELTGLKANRRGVFASGLANMQATLDHLQIESVSYVEFALREGILFSMIRQGDKFSLENKASITRQLTNHS